MNVDARLAHASTLMARRNYALAIDVLRVALGEEPDHARAHAILSICLLRQRRRFAAEHEARAALALAPELPDAHLALGWVALARDALVEAERAFEEALALAPGMTAALLGLSKTAEARGDWQKARALLEEALAGDPENVELLVPLADNYLAQGDVEAADARIHEALAIDAESADALAARGAIFLRRGETTDALEHALWALRQSPTSRRALVLLANVKARQSWWLGLWWRWNTWLVGMQSARRVVVLVGVYGTYRCATTLAAQLGESRAEDTLTTVWLAFVVYTWAAVPAFRRMLDRELAGVRMRRGF